MNDPTFLYHEKYGAEIFDSGEVDRLLEYNWKKSPARFYCPAYNRQNSFKIKWQQKYNKPWDIEIAYPIGELRLCKTKRMMLVKPKKKRGRPKGKKKK